MRDAARAIRDRLIAMKAAGAAVDATFLLVIDAGLGDADGAFGWMAEAIAARSPILFHIPTHPMIDGLRTDPRFDALLAQGGLTPVAV
jgi:hypothetical protein